MTAFINAEGREMGRMVPQNQHMVKYIIVEDEQDIEKDMLDIRYGIVEEGYYVQHEGKWIDIDEAISKLKKLKEFLILA